MPPAPDGYFVGIVVGTIVGWGTTPLLSMLLKPLWHRLVRSMSMQDEIERQRARIAKLEDQLHQRDYPRVTRAAPRKPPTPN